jgi:hypothetical protein
VVGIAEKWLRPATNDAIATASAAADTLAVRASERHREGAGWTEGGAATSGVFAAEDVSRNEILGPGFKLAAKGSKLPKREERGMWDRIGPNVGRFDGSRSGFDDLEICGGRGCIQLS